MHSFAWWPTLAVLVVATVTDLRTRRIPNWLVLPFLVTGFVVSAWLHGWHGIGQSFAGSGLGLLIYGFLFWMGGMGAGDVKLCAAIGAWIWPTQLLMALIITGMAGGIMVLCWVCWVKSGAFFKARFAGVGDLAFSSTQQDSLGDSEPTINNLLKRKMPYAPAIAIGTLMSFFAH